MVKSKKLLFNERNPLFPKDPDVGFVSVFYAMQAQCLRLWDRHDGIGCIRRVNEDVGSSIQILGPAISQLTHLGTPVRPFTTLGINLPIMVMIIKNLNRICSFEVQILDDRKIRRKFHFGTRVILGRKCRGVCYLPLGLHQDWNEVSIDFQQCTKKAYGTNYVETIRVHIYPNCRIRQIYFAQSPIPLEKVLSIMQILLAEESDTFNLKRLNSDTLLELLSDLKVKIKKRSKKKIKAVESDTTLGIQEVQASLVKRSQSTLVFTQNRRSNEDLVGSQQGMNPLETANLAIIQGLTTKDVQEISTNSLIHEVVDQISKHIEPNYELKTQQSMLAQLGLLEKLDIIIRAGKANDFMKVVKAYANFNNSTAASASNQVKSSILKDSQSQTNFSEVVSSGRKITEKPATIEIDAMNNETVLMGNELDMELQQQLNSQQRPDDFQKETVDELFKNKNFGYEEFPK